MEASFLLNNEVQFIEYGKKSAEFFRSAGREKELAKVHEKMGYFYKDKNKEKSVYYLEEAFKRYSRI